MESYTHGRHLLSFANGRLHFCECRISRNEAKQENGDSPEAPANQTQADEHYECNGNREQGRSNRDDIPSTGFQGMRCIATVGRRPATNAAASGKTSRLTDRIRCWRGSNMLRIPAAIEQQARYKSAISGSHNA